MTSLITDGVHILCRNSSICVVVSGVLTRIQSCSLRAHLLTAALIDIIVILLHTLYLVHPCTLLTLYLVYTLLVGCCDFGIFTIIMMPYIIHTVPLSIII